MEEMTNVFGQRRITGRILDVNKIILMHGEKGERFKE